MQNKLLSCFVLFLIGCGPQSIPYSQSRNAVDPNESARAHYKWGLEYAKSGDLSQALTEFKLAIEFEPRWAIPHYNLGSVYGNMGLLDKAILSWERATQLDSDFAKAHYNLAVAYAVKAEKALGADGKLILIEKSIHSLRQSVRGDRSALTAAQMEEAFDSFRELPQFKALFNDAEPK